MRFLYSALAIIALASTQINAKMLVASVGPITENPIPAWAAASDACSVVGSCDACQPEGNQYCFYKDSGDATCCQGNNTEADKSADSNDEPVSLVASVGPITENPIPSWAKPADTCAVVGSCDACQAEGPQYCFYKESGDATCCQGTPDESKPSKEEEPKYVSAGVGPITENPIPDWAQTSDTCATVGSCDACQPGGVQYCFYKESGDATCCQGSGPLAGNDEEPKLVSAGVGPIEEDPIPSWASASDVCTRKRSCDVCQPSNTQYCKYSDSGIPQCCSGNMTGNDADANADPESQQAF